MRVRVQILDGPLPAAASVVRAGAGVGARVVFEGIVRPEEDGRAIDGLHYEAYEPMAQRQIESICRELMAAHGILSMEVEHSRGWVPAGECSFRLTVCSPHRAEALRVMGEFIDLLKRDVPIWKSAGGSPPGRDAGR